MIPREILKKIRQIELRTNRIVTEFATGARLCEPQHSRFSENVENSELFLSCTAAAGGTPALRSFQPSPQIRRIPRIVPDGADNDLRGFGFDYKKDGIRPRFWKSGFAG